MPRSCSYLTLFKVLSLGVLSAALSGCAMNSASFAVSSPAATSGYTLSGTVQMAPASKQNADGAHPKVSPPIGGATVLLFAAGVKGYGSQARLLALTTSSTNGGGSFQFTNDPTHVNDLTNVTSTYSCPSYTFNSPDGTTSITADSLIYLVAIGGDTVDGTGTAHNNSHSILMAALGDCQSLVGHEPFVIMNSLSTVATIYALAPYINPTYPDTTYNGTYCYCAGGGLGASTTYMTDYGTAVRGGYTTTGSKKSVATLPLGYIGMRNAFSTVSRLVNLSTGSAVQSFTQTANVTGGTVNVTGTPEFAKLNTLADALTSCVYSSDDQYGNASSACITLFNYATSHFTGTSLGYTATLPSPNDTLRFTYYLAVNPTSGNLYYLNSVNNIYLLATPVADYQPTLASAPTDWTLSIAYTSTSNCGSSTTAQPFFSASPGFVATDLSGGVLLANAAAANNTVVTLDNTGTPTSCQFGALGTTGGAVIDASDNLWVSVPGSNAIYRSSSGSVLTVPTTVAKTGSTEYLTPYGMALDATGDLYTAVGSSDNGGSNGNIYELPGAQTAAAAPTPTPAVAYSFTGPVYNVALDNAGDIYTVSDSSSGYALFDINNSGTYTVASGNISVAPFDAVAVDSYGGLVTATTSQSGGQSYCVFYITYSTYYGLNAYDSAEGGLEEPTSVALDGAGNMWLGNSLPEATYTSGSQTLNLFGVSEFVSNAPTLGGGKNPEPVSPPGTLNCGTLGCFYQGGGYQKTSLGVARGIAVDISGYVWVAADLSSNGVANGNLVEIIGSGVPSVQPLSIAVRDNLVGALLP